MHLALAIGGCTVEELEHRMSEREFSLWNRYAGRFGLPTRRLEMHGAQIALLIAKTMGNVRGGVGMKDFMFDPPEAEPQADASLGAAVIHSMTSSRVRLLGQGRKKASH